MPDKVRERYHVSRLQECIPDLLIGNPLEPEPPDFVFENNGHRLGIELTIFFLPPRPGESYHQERQSLKNRIVAEAERLYAEAGGPALYVHVIFNERAQLRKKDTQPFAKELANAILAYPVPQKYSEVRVKIPWDFKPKWAGLISVNGSINGNDKLWRADAGGRVAVITREQIVEVIRGKAEKEPLARARCDELWLVIVNDHFSLAAQAEISTEALNASYECPFDRLIWLLPDAPRAIDLSLKL
jgi:hypothetical protein